MTALVTGAARGIGRATVLALVGRGWQVVAGVRDVEAARASLGEDDRLTIVEMDVTDVAQVGVAVAAAERIAGGALDAVVSNAGYALVGAVEEVELAEVRAVLETNTLGALAVVQASLPAMRRAGHGSVVFVSTVGAYLPTPLLGAYRASKAALNAIADALSMETRPYGIRVSRVEPGMVATDFPMSNRRSGSGAEGAGTYADLASALRAGMVRWRERHETSACVVAETIVRLIEAHDPPRVVPVGDDASALDGVEEDGLLEFLGIEWPRR